jgi:hypothetical protein
MQLEDITLRGALAVNASMASKELLLLENTSETYPWLETDALVIKAHLNATRDGFHESHSNLHWESLDDGPYKSIMNDGEQIWHEFRNNKYQEINRMGVSDMLGTMSTLCSNAGSSRGSTDTLMTLYRNGVADAFYSFNETANLYVEEI